MTPAVRALKAGKIPFVTREYDPRVEGSTFGEAVAEAIGVDPGRVYKTLIACTERKELVVAIVPVSATLDLKALARVAGAKSATMAEPKAAERSSGYVVGGISPLGQRRPLRSFVDESAMGHETLLVSAGKRGLQIELAPDDLIRACPATAAPIARRD